VKKRVLTVILTAVITIGLLSVTAAAASELSDAAKKSAMNVESGKSYAFQAKHVSNTTLCKVTLSEKGELKISAETDFGMATLKVWDKDGFSQVIDERIATEGTISNDNCLNMNREKKVGKGTYILKNLKKGTYYFSFYCFGPGNGGSGTKLSVKATYPTAVTKADGVSLSADLKKGANLQLGGIVSPSGIKSKATWKSDNTSVAVVSDKGLVTAKAKGTAVITCTVDDRTAKITIKVS